MAINTVPTGFVLVPPAGPAMPVSAMPISQPSFFFVPRAIAIAVFLLAGPDFFIISSGTSSSCLFKSLLYATIPPLKYPELPGILVIVWHSRPPVHDSPTAMVSLSFFRISAIISAVFLDFFTFGDWLFLLIMSYGP